MIKAMLRKIIPQGKLSLRIKSLLLFSLICFGVFALGYFWIYDYSTKLAINKIKDDILVVAKILASQIDGDAHQALYLNPDYDPEMPWPTGMNDERYWEISRLLYDVHLVMPQAYPYTYVRAGNDSVEIVVSSGALMDPVGGAYFKEPYTPGPTSVMFEGLHTEINSRYIIEDEWGTWLSAFVPITDSKGDLIGAVGVDYLASEIGVIQNRILTTSIPVFIGIYALFFIAALWTSNQLVSPVVKLTRAATRLGQGDYSVNFDEFVHNKIKDETDTLSETLSLMMKKISKRDNQIRDILSHQTDFIIRLDLDFHITFANTVFREAFGWNDDNQSNLKLLDIAVYKQDHPLLLQFVDRKLPLVSEESPEKVLEIRMIASDGQVRWIHWSVRAIYDGAHNKLEYQAVGRDITDLKQLQQELLITNQKLQMLSHQLITQRETDAKQLAQDLHDQVLSSLAGLIKSIPDIEDRDVVEKIYQEMIDILRQTIYDLRSPMLSYGLYLALLDYMDVLTENLDEGQELNFEIEQSDVRFEEIVEIQIFRIVQQACTNAYQHSRASRIKVAGIISEKIVEIYIEDNGIGFDPDAEYQISFEGIPGSRHFGITGMKERASLIGADFSIHSSTRQGSLVRIVFDPEKAKQKLLDYSQPGSLIADES